VSIALDSKGCEVGAGNMYSTSGSIGGLVEIS